MQFWHGGDLTDYKQNIKQKTGRFEYGPGLYLTSSYDVAKKYSKGNRKLYLVDVAEGNDINKSFFDINDCINFVKSNVKKQLHNDIINRLQKYNIEGKIKAFIFNNVLINSNAIQPNKTDILRQFYIDNNIDYEIVDNPFGYHDKMMVLYNVNKITNVKQVKSNDEIEKYDLHEFIKENMKSTVVFINENKLYPSSIISNLTKKLGDNSEDTLNKLAIFGLFRQATPFNTVKDINQIQSLDQLNELFNKWKESALTQLTSVNGELKGNKTAALTYLEAYIKNIKSLGNNAKPFSYRDTEKSLIDVCNNNGWVKGNGDSVSTYGIDKPHDQDILVDTDDVLIVKAPSKAKCIMYGKGYSWCISQSQLNYYTTYRINHGGTIYFVLNKKLPVNDNKRVCVVLRYKNDMYGVADKTNSGNMSGGPNVAGHGFSYVESVLPWVKGYGDKFVYNDVTESERQYQQVIEKPYEGDDLGDYIIHKSKGLKFNGEEIDPVDMLRDYLSEHVNITDNQFINLPEQMKIQVIEMGIGLSVNIIKSLDSTLKVRYAVVRLKNNKLGKLYLYTPEEILRVLNNVKDNLDFKMVDTIFNSIDVNQEYDLLKQIFPFVKDKLDRSIIRLLLTYTPEKQRYELILQFLPYIKDKLTSVVETLLSYTPEEQKYKLVKQIVSLVKDKLDSTNIYNLLLYTSEKQRYGLVKQIFPYIKDKLDGPIIEVLFNFTPKEQKYNLFKEIVPLVKDKLNKDIIVALIENAPTGVHDELMSLINQYKQSNINENKLNITVKKLINEELNIILSESTNTHNMKSQLNEVEPSQVSTKTIKYSDTLNTKIFDNDTKKLKPIVRVKLLEITKKYLESMKDMGIKFSDIVLTGSATNYNYNEQSDLDLHIVTDYNQINQDKDLLLNYFKEIKNDWSNDYKITIYGIPVEIFVQDMNAPEVNSASRYSLLNDKWIVEPEYMGKPKFDLDSIKKIAAEYLTRFDDIKREYKVDKDIDKAIEGIDKMKTDMADLRKKGLDSKLGEFSTENLAYKLLRNLLFFDKVNAFKEELVNKQLSLNELKNKDL